MSRMTSGHQMFKVLCAAHFTPVMRILLILFYPPGIEWMVNSGRYISQPSQTECEFAKTMPILAIIKHHPTLQTIIFLLYVLIV